MKQVCATTTGGHPLGVKKQKSFLIGITRSKHLAPSARDKSVKNEYKWGFYLIIIVNLFINNFSYSQSYYFKNYTIADGLAQDQILCMFQDSKGYVWLGTNGAGVSKFDGKTFHNLNETDGLVNNTVLNITEDRFGNIWFGTQDGISKYDGFNFENFTSKRGFFKGEVTTLCIDNNDCIWIGSRNSKVTYKSLISKDSSPLTRFEIINIESAQNTKVFKIIEDKKNNIWVATDNGLIKIDNKNNQILNYQIFTISDGLNSNEIQKLFETKNGTILVSSVFSVAKYIPDNNMGKLFENITVKEVDYKYTITDFAEDQYGNIWVGSFGDGILIFDEKKTNRLTKKNGLVNNNTWSLLCDNEGNMWIGYYGKGVSIYSGKLFEIYTTQNGLSDNFVWSVAEDNKNGIWVGTDIGGVSYFDGFNFKHYSVNDGLPCNRIRNIFIDSKNNIWVAGNDLAVDNGGISVLTNENFKKNNFRFQKVNTDINITSNNVYKIFEDVNNNLWFAMNNGVLFYKREKFIFYGDADGFKNTIVYSINQDKKGNMWFGTGGNGIVKYNPEEKHTPWQTLTTDDQLVSNDVRSILVDTLGNIWIGTGGGISVYNGTTFKTINSKQGLSSDRLYLMAFAGKYLWVGSNIGVDRIDFDHYLKTGNFKINYYGYNEGFKGIETNTNAVCVDSKNDIWFGTIQGIMKYNSSEDVIRLKQPITRISQVRLFGDPIFQDQNKEFEYNQNHFTFDYIGITYHTPEKVRYQYKLDGFDSQWSPLTKENYVNYLNLPPGSYSFKVKASDTGSFHDIEPVVYNFTIQTPFWQTWWFYIMSFLILTGVTVIIIRWRFRRLSIAKQILETKVLERTSELKHKTEQLEHITEELQRSNKSLEEFAYVASHDLKEPLRKIKVFSERLSTSINDKFKSEDKVFMDKVLNATDRMKNLIDSLLQYSRISTRKTPFELVDLNKIANEVLSDLEIRIKETNGSVEIKNLPKIEGDKLQMQQLFLNLLSNALKFYREGIPPVVIVESQKGENGFCEIFVKDNGVGFDVKYLDKLFKPFYRLHTKSNYEGTGIGSAICYKIIQRHNGKITAQSTPDKGSTFIITLPYKQKQKE